MLTGRPTRTGVARREATGAPDGHVELHCEDLGDPADPAALLIMGLGAQLPMWPDGFCARPLPAWRVIRLAFASPTKDAPAEEKFASEERNIAVFNGPNFLPPEPELWRRVRELADRCTYPAGILRQFDAMLGTGSLLGYSKAINAPTVVLHGSADPMVRPRNGRAVAAAIPGARFVVVGMGHDLPEPVWAPIVEALRENFARATNHFSPPRRT